MQAHRNSTLFNALAIAFGLCIASSSAWAKSAEDVRFEAITQRYFERFLAMNPETATALGDHRFDALTSDFSHRGVAASQALDHRT